MSNKAKQTARVIRCESGAPEGAIRLMSSDRVMLQEGQTRSVDTLTRVVKFDDDFYGEIDITRQKMLSFIKNFKANVYGQEIFIDVSHRSSEGAAATIKRLFVEGTKLRAELEWTPYGIDAVINRGFRYYSVEFHENYKDPETSKKHGPTLLGAGLTIRPRVKRIDPVSLKLSFDIDEESPEAISPYFSKRLSEEIETMWKELLEKLKKKLAESKLADALVTQLCEAYENAVKGITEEVQAKLLMETFATTGTELVKQLANANNIDAIKLDFSGLESVMANSGGGAGLTTEDVKKLMEDDVKRQKDEAKKLSEGLDANVKIFTDAVEGAEGLKKLSEDQRGKLLAAKDLVTADMSADQVRRLAEHQISLGDHMAVNAQLSDLGYPVSGTPRISMDETNNIKSLQEEIDKRLGITEQSDTKRFARTGGVLLEENKKFAEKVLKQLDQDRGARLHMEHKMLAGGDGLVSDVAVPAIFERTVIREALYQIVGLNFVNLGIEQFASSAIIPYSYRDTAAAGRNNTRVYEGQPVPRGGVIQTSETAYPIPQKIAFEASDELRLLTSTGRLDWNVMQENAKNATRIIAEDTEQMIFNEQLHAADEYGAAVASAEDLELQADGTDKVFILANFPVVHPRLVYDLQGNQVGSTVNPITVTYNSVAALEYDGTGTQSSGTYYVMNYNKGEIYLVDEVGAIQIPADTTAYTITYSYVTNGYNFNTDNGSVAVDLHWDTFLYRYGLRISEIEDVRYHMANFGVMSGNARTQIEQAKKFTSNNRVPATELSADGNLGRVKDVPNFKTSAPGLWMGDDRVVIGERDVTRLRMMKAWSMEPPENQKDANGRFTGKKESYGTQHLILHTPTQLKRALTSMNLYSVAARVARVAP